MPISTYLLVSITRENAIVNHVNKIKYICLILTKYVVVIFCNKERSVQFRDFSICIHDSIVP